MPIPRPRSPFAPAVACAAMLAAGLAAGLARGQQPLPDEVAERIRTEGLEHSEAERFLRELTDIGHRLTGSPNFTRATLWAERQFAALGLDVEREPWGEWRTVWSPGAWRGRVVEPEAFDLVVATAAWTAGTDGPQRARVVAAPQSPDLVAEAGVRGRWLLAVRLPARAVRAACQSAGALGVLYRAGDASRSHPTRMRMRGDETVALRAIDDVPTMPEVGVRADHFDRLSTLCEAGRELEVEIDIGNRFADGPVALHNVIASMPGTEMPDEVVIVSAHLDSWHLATGCTDNGTGVATTLEAARILQAVGARPKRTILFCLWGGEEQGLMGSRAYVTRHRTGMDRVSAVFNHDTGTNWAQSLLVTKAMSSQLEPVFGQVVRLLSPPDVDFDGPVFELRTVPRLSGGRGGSDHASFLAVGVPGLSWGLEGRADYFQETWHTQWDTFDKAIDSYQRHTATVVAMAALGTANLDGLLSRDGVETRAEKRRRQSAMLAGAWFGAELDGFAFRAVEEGGRAAQLGVEVGDVLVAVDGRRLEHLRQLFQFAREAQGKTFALTLRRGARTFAVTVERDALGRRRD